MLCNGQNVVHVKTRKLVKLVYQDAGYSWHWPIMGQPGSKFIDVDGNEFIDRLLDYSPIEDEFGSPVAGNNTASLPDLSLLPYLSMPEKEKATRRQTIIASEITKIIDFMSLVTKDKSKVNICHWTKGSRRKRIAVIHDFKKRVEGFAFGPANASQRWYFAYCGRLFYIQELRIESVSEDDIPSFDDVKKIFEALV